MTSAAMSNPSELRPELRLTPEQARSRRARNVAVSLIVGFLVVLFYVITIAKLGGNVFTKTM
jgi:hypothetical protein